MWWERVSNFIATWTFEGITFGLFMAVFIVLLFRLHNSKHSKFMVDNLLVDDTTGKASTSKMGELIALVVSTWIVVHLTINSTLTADFMGMYLAAWVLNRGFRHFVSKKYGDGVEEEPDPSYNDPEEPEPEEPEPEKKQVKKRTILN